MRSQKGLLKTEFIQIKIKDYEKRDSTDVFMLLNIKRFMYVLRAKIYCNTKLDRLYRYLILPQF